MTHSKIGFCNKYHSDDDEILNYDFLESQLIHPKSFNPDIQQVVKNMKCEGCGVDLQIEAPTKIGYIPQMKILDFINNKDENKTIEHMDKNELIINEFEQIHDKSTLKKIMKLKNKKKSITCERCYKLINYQSFDNSNQLNSNPKAEDTNKIDNYTFLLKKINIQKLIDQIMTRISNKAHVFYICDVTELEATINKNILKEIKRKEIGLTFIVNKFDVLPTKVVEERVNIWVGEMLKDLTKDIEGITYNYILVSSITGHNFDYVVHRVKKIKERAKEEKIPRPKIYVIGFANVGKSSFINKLILRANKFVKERQINKIKYTKNYNIKDDSLFEKNEPFEKSNLTASPLPGTTIGITKVESMKMGVKFFDTPGIPNKNSITYVMPNYLDIISTTINRKIIPFTSSVKQGYSIWIGSVARIDFMSGEDKYFSFFFSHNVTIHRTPMLNAEDFFSKHAGGLLRPLISKDVNLKKHTFNLKCEIFSILNFDICITGLGWFSISGKGLAQLEVYVPDGVTVTLRNKPIMPFEIKSRGVKKFFGKTINADSKINRRFNNVIIDK